MHEHGLYPVLFSRLDTTFFKQRIGELNPDEDEIECLKRPLYGTIGRKDSIEQGWMEIGK